MVHFLLLDTRDIYDKYMKLFIAPNLKEDRSKIDGELYPYITKKGLPIAFEEGSLFWKTFGENGHNAVAIHDYGDIIISPKGSINNKKGNKLSFELTPVQGYVSELETDLKLAPNHEREEFVIEEVKKAIDHIITAMGGYLSVSCNGNLNPISGETGEEVNIKVVSLSPPAGVLPPIPQETAPKIEDISPEPVFNKGQEEEIAAITQTPVITENPSQIIPPVTPESNSENPPAAPAPNSVPSDA